MKNNSIKRSMIKNKHIIIYFSIIILGLVVRIRYLNFISGDYANFLKPWVEQIRDLNGFAALKENVGNYNVPYIIILILISYLKCEPLISIKIVSILFDLIVSIVTYGIIYKITNNKKTALFGSMVVWVLPTVMLNGAMWGQCDSIYCAFVLLSIYFLLDKRFIFSFVMLGIAFAFKLQTVFILPLYILMVFREKNVKWYYFLIIPLVNFILCLPAIIAGRNIVEVLTIYLNQTGYYKALTANFPNIYSIVQGSEFAVNYGNIITLGGILITIIVFGIVWFVVLIKKIDFDFENIIAFGIFSVVVATFLLPRMHDRYMYVADILSVIWYICYRKKIFVPLTINFISLYSYLMFLVGGTPTFMIKELVLAIVIITFVMVGLYIIFLNNRLKPFIIFGSLLIIIIGLSANKYYLPKVICASIYMGVIIYYSIYIIRQAINKKCEILKIEGK